MWVCVHSLWGEGCVHYLWGEGCVPFRSVRAMLALAGFNISRGVELSAFLNAVRVCVWINLKSVIYLKISVEFSSFFSALLHPGRPNSEGVELGVSDQSREMDRHFPIGSVCTFPTQTLPGRLSSSST